MTTVSSSVPEAIETHGFTKQFGWAQKGLCLFWTDDNSNYAGAYVKGPLAPRVCLVDHEEPDIPPAFRSPESFVRALHVGADEDLDWYELPRDYPVLGAIKKFEPAIDRLAEVAAETIPNDRGAAKRALLKIGTSRALEAAQR